MRNVDLHVWIVELKRFELVGDAVVVSDDASVFPVQSRRVSTFAYDFLVVLVVVLVVVPCGDVFVVIWPSQGGKVRVTHWNSIIGPRQIDQDLPLPPHFPA